MSYVENFSSEELPQERCSAKVLSATCFGLDVVPVEVEAQIFSALRRFALVGLPDGVLRESKDRVRCAIENSGFGFPNSEVIVSLAPAALPKFGASFDLAVALSVLAADGQVKHAVLESVLVLGELSLDGSIKPVPGVLSICLQAKKNRITRVIIPALNAREASLIEGVAVYPVSHLTECVSFLNGHQTIEAVVPRALEEVSSQGEQSLAAQQTFGDVVGQYAAKRAMQIVAAGGHNLLMVGPPGAGKSMLAMRLPSIMPPLTRDEAVEITRIYSTLIGRAAFRDYSGKEHSSLIQQRPFRAPHHTISAAGLIGGGSEPLPGEISLSHRGVLFLDELPEFKRDALEALRQPLESGRVLISRSRFHVQFPSRFLLVAAMNPCPCGRRGTGYGDCKCSPLALQRYQMKISGPLLDRIDLQLSIAAVPVASLQAPLQKDPTAEMAFLVNKARSIQRQRFKKQKLNSQMSSAEIKTYCTLFPEAVSFLEKAASKLVMSARAYQRILKVSRTIADLEGQESISKEHIAEAVSYRLLPGN